MHMYTFQLAVKKSMVILHTQIIETIFKVIQLNVTRTISKKELNCFLFKTQ